MKIKIRIHNNHSGGYTTRINLPNGKDEEKKIGYSLFGLAIKAAGRRHELRFSDGYDDFNLTEKEYQKFTTALIDKD